jgi:5-methylcytosine-specific restriction endonuclease McrA
VRAGSFGDSRRGTRHERGYGSAWDRQRALVLRRDAGICQHCMRATGAVHVGTEVDHIVPKALGGTDDADNLQTICRTAHRAKTQAEAQASKPGGDRISTAVQRRTDAVAKVSGAQVSWIFS